MNIAMATKENRTLQSRMLQQIQSKMNTSTNHFSAVNSWSSKSTFISGETRSSWVVLLVSLFFYYCCMLSIDRTLATVIFQAVIWNKEKQERVIVLIISLTIRINSRLIVMDSDMVRLNGSHSFLVLLFSNIHCILFLVLIKERSEKR